MFSQISIEHRNDAIIPKYCYFSKSDHVDDMDIDREYKPKKKTSISDFIEGKKVNLDEACILAKSCKDVEDTQIRCTYIYRLGECCMLKTKITMAIILISLVGMVVNSGGIAVSNVQATADESDKTQSSNDNARSSVNSTTQTFSDELPPSDDNNEAQTSDDSNEVISTNQDLLPGLEQPNQQVLRFEETPLQTFNTSTEDLQNPDIKSDVNQKTTSSQNDLQSNYLAEMPFHPTVKDCYKSDGKMSFDGQWSCAEHNCTVAGYIACSSKVQGTTHDEYDKTKQIGNPFFGECKKDESGKCIFK